MHLTALVDSPNHVCCRYRLTPYHTPLLRAGHTLEVRVIPRNPWSWLRLANDLAPAATVIVQRKLLTHWQLFLLRRHERRLIFDFDDAIFLRDSYSPRGTQDPRRRRAFERMVRSCQAVSAGNDYLRDHAYHAGCRGPAVVIPTCVDIDRYPAAIHQREGAGVELVWIGSSSTLQGLERIRPLLESIGRRYPGVRLKLVCDRFLKFEHLVVRACPWSETMEAEALASSDIGIGWVPDDPWSRGKCGLKLLQYMAAGLPVIANPVGVQAKIVRHGETGFHAESEEQWFEALDRLIHDAALRQRMGRAGRSVVEFDYSIAAGARQWLSLLDELQGVWRKAG